MIPSILFPRWFKWIGLALAIAGYVGGAVYERDPDDVMHIEGLLIQISILAGLLLIANARQKIEDEMIRHMRLTSLQWSVLLVIVLRVAFKMIAFNTRDMNWLPHIEANVLLLIYLLLFYYQVYVSDMVAKLLKRKAQ